MRQFVKLDSDLTRDTRHPATPDPACFSGGRHVYCVGQVIDMFDLERDALDSCNLDKTAIRKIEDGTK